MEEREHGSWAGTVCIYAHLALNEFKCLDRLHGGQSNHHGRVASRKIWSVEELETLPVGTKPKTTPSIAWRIEAQKEEALNDLPWEEEKGPSSIRPTLELFQGPQWENSWETGWSAYGPSWAHRYHLELNWSELNCRHTYLFVTKEVCSAHLSNICWCSCSYAGVH